MQILIPSLIKSRELLYRS